VGERNFLAFSLLAVGLADARMAKVWPKMSRRWIASNVAKLLVAT